jgi:hypothetical protein
MMSEPIYDQQLFRATNFRLVWLNQENERLVKESLKTREVDGVAISTHLGFAHESIEMLLDLPNLSALRIGDPENLSCEALEELSDLRYLSLGKRKSPVDFSKFPKLVDLQTTWHLKDSMPQEFRDLQSLFIWGYSSRQKNLAGLPKAKKLRSLGFVRANFESLGGIEVFGALEEISLAHCAKLHSISDLTRTLVERLVLTSCKNITDLGVLVGCKNLKSIRMESGPKLKSLSILNEFPSLEEFRFVKTEVVDGDMTPLLKLKRVGFIASKKFSHTPEQIKSAINDKSP